MTRNLTAPDDVVVPLSATEFKLLRLLLNHPGRVMNRDQLIEMMQLRDAGQFDHALDVQITRLRQRLGDDVKEPAIIKTVRGQGYVLAAAVNSESLCACFPVRCSAGRCWCCWAGRSPRSC